MQVFADHHSRCDNCQETWIKKNTLNFWYTGLYRYVS